MATGSGESGDDGAARRWPSAVLGFLGGVGWAAYLTGLSVVFRGAAPGQPPYSPETVVYARLMAVPPVLVLVGVPAVRSLPGASGPWGRRGIGLVVAGTTLVAVGVLAVTLLAVPGRSPGALAAVAPVGLFVQQFGGTFLGYALWTADGAGTRRADGDGDRPDGGGSGPADDGRSGPADGGGDDRPGGDERTGDGGGSPPDGESTERAKLLRVAGGLLVLSVPATLAGLAGTSLLYSAVPFYAGVSVPVGIGWAGACYGVLIDAFGDDSTTG